jgi:plastocyanin
VTADDASFTSDTIAGGATFSHTFDTAGTFAYHCTIHSQMKATVTVTP